jgi:hypothetical protein
VVSLPENGTELKTILGQLDNALLVKALEGARKVYKVILEQTDETLAKHHGPGLQIEHLRDVWYQTCLGPVKINTKTAILGWRESSVSLGRSDGNEQTQSCNKWRSSTGLGFSKHHALPPQR